MSASQRECPSRARTDHTVQAGHRSRPRHEDADSWVLVSQERRKGRSEELVKDKLGGLGLEIGALHPVDQILQNDVKRLWRGRQVRCADTMKPQSRAYIGRVVLEVRLDSLLCDV